MSLRFVNLLKGTFAIGHRPKINKLSEFKRNGATHVITLLSEKEGALNIKKSVIANDLAWLWLPLENASPPAAERLDEIQATFSAWKDLLNNGSNLYMHCSAGIHRTGMIGYAFLRFLEFNSIEAMELLARMRTVTSQEVGYHRLAWGDGFSVISNTNSKSDDNPLEKLFQVNHVGCLFYSHSAGGGYQYRGKIEKVYQNGRIAVSHVETVCNENYDEYFTDPFSIPGNWQPYDDFEYGSTDIEVYSSSEGIRIEYSHVGAVYIHPKQYNPNN